MTTTTTKPKAAQPAASTVPRLAICAAPGCTTIMLSSPANKFCWRHRAMASTGTVVE